MNGNRRKTNVIKCINGSQKIKCLLSIHNIIENPSDFWEYPKVKKKSSTFPLEMKYNDRKCNQPGEIVEMFADYFEGLYEKDDEPLMFEEIYGRDPENSWEVNLTMTDIEKAINDLEVKSSAGPDNISPIIVKSNEVFVWPLWILHQKSMELGKISSRLKISRERGKD